MKWTALYIRTSTDRQETGLEAQKRALEKFCHDQGIENFKIYEDFGISGSKQSRPGLNRLMEDVSDEKVERVVVYSFSRLARNTAHLLSVLSLFNQMEISFISLTEKIDTSSAMGRAIYTIISALGQLELELASERIKNGLENAKSKGKTLGRKPSRNSKLIQELRKKDYTYREIAKLAECSPATVCRELNGHFEKAS